jgi:glycosyltransferase involved in cell wall biosynthesis
MEATYHLADLFLLPSHSEGFPLAILEAMASGLPVVTSKGQTFGEIIADAGAGLICERNPAAMCTVLNTLFASPNLVHSIKARAREFVVRDYSVASVRTRYCSLVESLVSPAA